jgi:hypothetical protein
MIKSSVGSLHGVGSVLSVVSSQLDSKPWSQEIQDPFVSIIQEGSEATANFVKGNMLKGFKQGTAAVFKSVGAPITPHTILFNWGEKALSEK